MIHFAFLLHTFFRKQLIKQVTELKFFVKDREANGLRKNFQKMRKF